MAPRVVSVGNVVVDLVAEVPALPERGGDVLATRGALAIGGAFTVLSAVRRQGVAAAYAGAHGTGPFGDRVRAALAEEDVAVLLPAVPDVDTGWDVALVEPGGERSFVTLPGAEARLGRGALASVAVAPGDLVHVSGYGLAHAVNGPAIASWLPSVPASAVVVFDPGPLVASLDARLLAAVRARADWESVNEREARLATGTADPFEAAARVGRSGGGAIVRLGARGCLVRVPGGGIVRLHAFPVEAVDTNGAGDVHVGVFLAGLAEGLDAPAAAVRANAAAALAVARRGPATAPARAELAAFLAAHPAPPPPPSVEV